MVGTLADWQILRFVMFDSISNRSTVGDIGYNTKDAVTMRIPNTANYLSAPAVANQLQFSGQWTRSDGTSYDYATVTLEVSRLVRHVNWRLEMHSLFN